jgi:acyl-CoA synthetase (NDP forming)
MGLERILDARSVAVVGASRDERKRGHQAVRALLDSRFDGDIYPVNPHEERILGLHCQPSVDAIPGPVDLALITTRADTVPGVLEACGKRGVAGAVIVGGGFGELGGEGRRLQERIVQIARHHGLRLVGPNTSGLINVHSGLNLVGLPNVPRGDIALVSQSGNMGLHLITEASIKSQKGFSYYVGVGNEADIRFHEYVDFLTEDPKTRVIVVYVEGLSDGRAFLQQAYRTTLKKPIVLLKGGRSATGSRSVGSHTGALAGISEVSRTAFTRAGIITLESSDELLPAAEALSSLPPMARPSVAILADGGGHATIAADVLSDDGLRLPHLGRATRDQLAAVLSPNASLRNPVDVAGSTDSDPGVFADCARILLEDPAVSGLLLVGLFGGYGIRFADRLRFIEEDAAHRMGKLVRELGKPIVVHSLYTFAHPHALDLLRYYGIPVVDSVDVACRLMAVLARYGHRLAATHRRTTFVFRWGAKARPEGRALVEGALAEGRRALLEHEAKHLLALHGAPVSADRLAATAAEAADLAEAAAGPIALKVSSPDVLHKSDVGGVRLGLEGRDAVHSAFEEIVAAVKRQRPGADLRGCVVSPMAAPGVEVIIGTKVDAQFGPVVMFGIGGILVEVLKDVVFRVLPVSRYAAREMVSEIRSAPILNGVRGQPPVDHDTLVRLILTVSELVQAYPEIHEMDLNPVIARPDGASVVDARILLRRNHRNGR